MICFNRARTFHNFNKGNYEYSHRTFMIFNIPVHSNDGLSHLLTSDNSYDRLDCKNIIL